MTDWMKPQQGQMNVNATVSMGDAPTAPAAEESGPVKDISTAEFGPEVIEASGTVPVVVDFWAPWCGPCKQLGPIIENAVAASNGAVRLVKMDIDQHPEIASQMGIQSIPAVVAFVGGQPVDAFMGAKPESEVKEFIAKIAAMGPGGEPSEGPDMAAAVEQANGLIAEKDFAGAAQMFAAVLQQEPGNLDAIAGLGQCYLAVGEFEQARGLIVQVPEDMQSEGPIAAFLTALELAEQAANLGDLGQLAAKVEAEPVNHDARFDYAIALNARGEREEAAEQLLTIIRKDRKWRDDGARVQLVEFFDVWGNADPATISGRRALSSILFS
ncbi:thioredoxin [Pseudahrensia aquimaris]|uniref:Thioredoxin n=1 Tax=Pseudahrensia aquimaris TaxID=744461 RepID=A0ABW3FFV5_9HYPH